MRNILFTILFFLSLIKLSNSQELKCQVQVSSIQVQGTNKVTFDALQSAILEFMNNQKWTNDNFKNDERIECNILINITKYDPNIPNQYTASIEVQSRRPVYNTSYNAVLLNYIDQEFQFTYVPSQPLIFTPNLFTDNLTSVLAYYAYLIIGLDYDSFSLKGGTSYLQQSLTIVSNAQNAVEPGWTYDDNDHNRYWIINNMLDATFIPLRECMYKYYRLGLDIMSTNKEKGRAVILQSLQGLEKVHKIKPLSFSMQIFFNPKSDELINIFSGATPDEQSAIVTLLNEIDPTNSNKYQKILTNNQK